MLIDFSDSSNREESVQVMTALLRWLAGDGPVDMGASLNFTTSKAIKAIVKNADEIQSSASTASNFSTTIITPRSRSYSIEEMERKLNILGG
ncbi:hypothetical protein T05_6297 [Trichinella murrelli]|uniref:Uncharacterized protein n=1 Tax=Trichinella murrelli TaxID=144512 RepID=A0A0V0T7H1_9BILA|nr:hypothetical protein T05_6297 [Trichinella murrelli]